MAYRDRHTAKISGTPAFKANPAEGSVKAPARAQAIAKPKAPLSEVAAS